MVTLSLRTGCSTMALTMTVLGIHCQGRLGIVIIHLSTRLREATRQAPRHKLLHPQSHNIAYNQDKSRCQVLYGQQQDSQKYTRWVQNLVHTSLL